MKEFLSEILRNLDGDLSYDKVAKVKLIVRKELEKYNDDPASEMKQVNQVEPNQIQYAYCEYADYPMCFKQQPTHWVQHAIHMGQVVPEFRTEDYWYLVVETKSGKESIGPGDWIIRNIDGSLSVLRQN